MNRTINIIALILLSTIVEATAATFRVQAPSKVEEGRTFRVEFILDGVSYDVTTDEYGVATIESELTLGVHEIVSHDKETGLYVANVINVTAIEIDKICNQNWWDCQ